MSAATPISTCYRHPDRETRLGCTACERPVCVDCVTPAPVGQRCPDCAKPDRATVRAARQARAPVSIAILAVAVGIFVIGTLVPALRVELFVFGAQANQAVVDGQTYRLLTAGFLHAGLMHVLFNMWALSVFGPPMEREVGSLPFAGLYVASMLAGGVAYLYLAPGGLAVGASGAIFGLFGAWFAVSYGSRHTALGAANLRQMGVLLLINAALPLLVPAIAWQAHLGGFLAGAGIALVWTRMRRGRSALLARAGVPALVAVAAWIAAVAA